MAYTLRAAAAATGLNKTTVLRAIKSGRISGVKNERGKWRIEPAELDRIYSLWFSVASSLAENSEIQPPAAAGKP
jgi:excisionase family DNA binding protein